MKRENEREKGEMQMRAGHSLIITLNGITCCSFMCSTPRDKYSMGSMGDVECVVCVHVGCCCVC